MMPESVICPPITAKNVDQESFGLFKLGHMYFGAENRSYKSIIMKYVRKSLYFLFSIVCVGGSNVK